MTALLEKRLTGEVGQKWLGDTLGCSGIFADWAPQTAPPGQLQACCPSIIPFPTWFLSRNCAQGLKRGGECSARVLSILSPSKAGTRQALSYLWKSYGQISERSGCKKKMASMMWMLKKPGVKPTVHRLRKSSETLPIPVSSPSSWVELLLYTIWSPKKPRENAEVSPHTHHPPGKPLSREGSSK